MSENTRYKLHRILDIAIERSESGDDTSINIFCSADGSSSVFVSVCDGEFAKDVSIDTVNGFIDKNGNTNIEKMMEQMNHCLTKRYK